ncbi:MAG: hypothetical protein ACLR8Y_00015 [Alistipes indistinctus]
MASLGGGLTFHAHLCAMEAYSELPLPNGFAVRERNTRIEALISLHVSGDVPHGGRSALSNLSPRSAEGITASCCPGLPDGTSAFSLCWINMVCALDAHAGDQKRSTTAFLPDPRSCSDGTSARSTPQPLCSRGRMPALISSTGAPGGDFQTSGCRPKVKKPGRQS